MRRVRETHDRTGHARGGANYDRRMPAVSSLCLATALALLTAATAAQDQSPAVRTAPDLGARVDALLAKAGPTLRAGIWVADQNGNVLFSRNPATAMPTASAIKVAYLVELFGAMAPALDRTPARTPQVLEASAHPALAPFAADQQAEIGSKLRALDARALGATMIHGKDVSNAVYNAAANLVTAELGGPRGLGEKIAARWDGPAEITVRRYMLAAREAGDNEATPRALGRVLLALARRDVPALPLPAQDAARACLAVGHEAGRGQHFAKSGSLDSTPLTRVLSGWYEANGRALVYVVMLAQPAPAAGAELQASAVAVRDALLGEFIRRTLWVGV